ncbi:hypothetical protein BT96DRAFT_1002543 [Gymnopus androsaceus JB14]|uniref:Uncharacterized protein n=1 Tax=Gymnopus androsaceus JB14 TaxID=1447944 RepID=A0A6A4GWM7_9AGAR|nr:hypothetical protein BT96DRAFT_1002543 [Gymnopus androsaceus JB14]
MSLPMPTGFDDFLNPTFSTPSMPSCSNKNNMLGNSAHSAQNWSLPQVNHENQNISSIGQNYSYTMQLEQKNLELQRQVLVLSTKNSLLKSINDKLVRSVPTLLDLTMGTNQSQQKQHAQTDFPNVKYWHQVSWTASNKEESQLTGDDDDGERRRGNSAASQGINVSMKFIVEADGMIIDGYRATAMRNAAYGLFVQFRDEGRHPVQWTQALHEIKTRFYREMTKLFPELGYCSNDWKSQRIATTIYPGWYGRHGKGTRTKVKTEVKIEANWENTSSLGLDGDSLSLGKRKACTDARDDGKKAKTGLTALDDSTNHEHVAQRLTIVNPLKSKKKVKKSNPVLPLPAGEVSERNEGNRVQIDNDIPMPEGDDIHTSPIPAVTDPTEAANNAPVIFTQSSGTGGIEPVTSNTVNLPPQVALHSVMSGQPSVSDGTEPAGIVTSNTNDLPPPVTMDLTPTGLKSPASPFTPATARASPNLASVRNNASESMDSTLTTTSANSTSSSPSVVTPPDPAAATSDTINNGALEMMDLTSATPSSSIASTSLITAPPATAASKTKVAKGMARPYQPSKTSKTPRGLCAIDWMAKHPKATVADFAAHWDSVKGGEIGKAYEARSDSAAAKALQKAAQ